MECEEGQNSVFDTICRLHLIEMLMSLKLLLKLVLCTEKEQCCKVRPVVGFRVSKKKKKLLRQELITHQSTN